MRNTFPPSKDGTVIYTTAYYGEWYAMAADFTQATDSVWLSIDDNEWHDSGLKVAFFQNSPENAMRYQIEKAERMAADVPDILDNPEVIAEINEAIKNMKMREYISLEE